MPFIHHVFVEQQIFLDPHIFVLNHIQFFFQNMLGRLLDLNLPFDLYYFGLQLLIFKTSAL